MKSCSPGFSIPFLISMLGPLPAFAQSMPSAGPAPVDYRPVITEMVENAHRDRGPTEAFEVADLKLHAPVQAVCFDHQQRQRRAWYVRAVIRSQYVNGDVSSPVTVYYWFAHNQLFAISGSPAHCD